MWSTQTVWQFDKTWCIYIKKITRLEKNKRVNILNVSDNIESSIFDGVYLDYSHKPEPEKEERFADTTKLRRQRATEIVKQNHAMSLDLFRKYYGYLSPSNMYRVLNDTKDAERNTAWVDLIRCTLVSLKGVTENIPINEEDRIKENAKVMDIVELILHFNEEINKGKTWKY